MRTVLMVAMLVVAAAPAGAQERLADQLRKGIVEEEASQNLDKAIQAYQAIVARYDEDRKTAGTALFRLAECYRKAGKREQAIATYQRVVREFPDQAAMVETSHQQLAALGATEVREVRPARAPAAGTREPLERPREVTAERPQAPTATRTDSLEATRLEMVAVQKRLADVQKKVELGLAAPADVEALQAQLVALQQRARQQEAEVELNHQMIQSVEAEMSLVEQRITAIEKNVKAGVASPQDAELLQLRRDLLGLQRKLDELRAGLKR